MKTLCYYVQPAGEQVQLDTPGRRSAGLLADPGTGSIGEHDGSSDGARQYCSRSETGPHSTLSAHFQIGGWWLFAVALLLFTPSPPPALAQVINIDTSQTTRLGNGPNSPVIDNTTVNVNANIEVTDDNAISLHNNNTIVVNSPAIVQTTTTVNDSGRGQYAKGDNTIEFNNSNTITIMAGATVSATGVGHSSEAINPIGSGNTIINFGTIKGEPSSAIFFENIDTSAGRNTVDNFGTIQAIPTGNNPGLTGQAIGSFGSVGVNFINEAGAKVIGNLDFQGGDDNVTLFPGSKITGDFDGGGGFNTLTLNGAAGTNDSFSGEVKNFQTLTKTGPGSWTLTGSIGDNGGNDPLTVFIDSGVLNLTGNNAHFNGSIIVNPGPNLSTPGPNPQATLSAAAQSLPPLITDHGIVVFNQTVDGTYSGLVQGTGQVVKTGAGTLTLVGANTYSGGTFLLQGAVAIPADDVLGAATGGLFFAGGTLRFDSAFDLAPTRAITLLARGGTIDTNGNVISISQPITGVGALT